MGNQPPPQKGAVPPSGIFGPYLLWPNGWMDQDGTWREGGPWSRPHCARWEPRSPPPKRGRTPDFRPISIVAKRLDASRCHLYRGRPQSKRSALDGEPAALSPKRGRAPPNFRPVYCDQMAGWIKMPLATEVGLGPNDNVLHGDPALPKKGTAPHFWPLSVVATRLDGLRCHLAWR